jgi:hypothetical protein
VFEGDVMGREGETEFPGAFGRDGWERVPRV